MVIIKFREGLDWYKANWVFRQMVSDVVANFPKKSELEFVMEQAEALGALFLDSMRPDLAAEVTHAIKKVAEDTVNGILPGWSATTLDEKKMRDGYVNAMSELLDLIRKEEQLNGNLIK